MVDTSANSLPRHWWLALLRGWTWRMAWRDSRAQRQRLALFGLAIVAGMAALVAIRALKTTVQAGVESQAKALLGSDLHIATRQPVSPEVFARLQAQASRASRETDFSSMLSFLEPAATCLVEVRGLEGDFPFYGQVETMPPSLWTRLFQEGGVLLEPALLDQFNAKIGDRVKLGELELVVLGTVTKPPPRGSRFSGFAPSVYMRLSDLPATGLLGTRSLASFHIHLEAPATRVARLKKAFESEGWRFETPENRRESLEKVLANLQEFLGVVALVALMLGAVGVAGAMHAHISRRTAAVAVLRCLGCPGQAAFAIYLVQALVLGAAGALAGAIAGAVLHALAVLFLQSAFPIAISPWPKAATVAQTTAAGYAVCAAFALLPLLRVSQIAPAAALREGWDTSRRRQPWLAYTAVGLLLVGLSLIGTEHRVRALVMDGALLASFLLLAGTARLLMRGARSVLRPGWPYLLRQGVANLYRPQNQTLLFLLSLGLGVFLLLTVLLTRNLLLQRMQLADLDQSPNLYLIDVQPDQVEGVAALLRSMQLPLLESAPMVTMRLSHIRGIPIRELGQKLEVPKWVLQREYRSTYRPALNATEKVIAGTWIAAMPPGDAPVPVSLEKDMARDLQVNVGDKLTLDVQGTPIQARVGSIREVDWSKFNLNFFMLFPPGVLEEAPGFHVVTTRLPDGVSPGALQRALAQKFPNITAIDLAQILETVRSILEKITRAISIIGAFTVLAGVPVLLGTLWNGREQRMRESVLLRTLGASARQVRTILLIEYAALGVLSAMTAVLLALAANWVLARFVFEVPAHASPTLLAAAVAACSALAVAGGWAMSRGIAQQPPLEVLRRIG